MRLFTPWSPPAGLLCLVLFAASTGSTASAAEYALSPSMSQSQINAIVAGLKPGDLLRVPPGTYQALQLDLMGPDGQGIKGTETAPIVIRGERDAAGNRPHIRADTDRYHEPIRLRSGLAHVTIEGLHLSTFGSDVQSGIHFDDDVHHVTIRDNEISDITGIGIQIDNKDDVHHIHIEDNHIHHTGTITGNAYNGGQPFTAGGFWVDTATTNVHHLTLRRNLIHHGFGIEGDCIKFMYGVYASVIEDNVLYECPRGVEQAENYGITSYGSGPGHYENPADNNIIRRNLLLGTAGLYPGERNVAIWAGPGTVVENNVIIGSNIGIAARLEDQVPTMRNLRVVNNTVYGATYHAFSIYETQTADSSVVVANNVLVALHEGGLGYEIPHATGGMFVQANYYQGLDWAQVDPPAMIPLAVPPETLFLKPSTAVPGADFMPMSTSLLVGSGATGIAPAEDFDGRARPTGQPVGVGAYHWNGSMDGHWPLSCDFKPASEGAGEEQPQSGDPTPTPVDPTPTPVDPTPTPTPADPTPTPGEPAPTPVETSSPTPCPEGPTGTPASADPGERDPDVEEADPEEEGTDPGTVDAPGGCADSSGTGQPAAMLPLGAILFMRRGLRRRHSR